MAVPVRVIWNLRISPVEKISIGVVFLVGILTMAAAIIRSVSLESSVSSGQVSTTWLILVRPCRLVDFNRLDVHKLTFFPQWAGIEGAVGMCTREN